MKKTALDIHNLNAARDRVRRIREQREATLDRLDAAIDADTYVYPNRGRAKRTANSLSDRRARYTRRMDQLDAEIHGE